MINKQVKEKQELLGGGGNGANTISYSYYNNSRYPPITLDDAIIYYPIILNLKRYNKKCKTNAWITKDTDNNPIDFYMYSKGSFIKVNLFS